jgi:SOS-response transcriptional repressor LexA
MAALGRVVNFGDYRERVAEWLPLLVAMPGQSDEISGVLLLDKERDELHVKLRNDWMEIASEEDAEVLAEIERDLALKARELGGERLLQWLDEHASHTVRVGSRQEIAVRNFPTTLQRLYRENVRTVVRRFKTHLPVYSLEVAAGLFLTNPEDIEAEEWTEAPGDLKLDPNMFVAQIRGHSMEPRIPDGSLCIFRWGVAGSRIGRLVLVWNLESGNENRYTVKRYKSEKKYSEEGFEHTRIRLESLNPDYPSWDLDVNEEKYRIIAEFVRVLEEGV